MNFPERGHPAVNDRALVYLDRRIRGEDTPIPLNERAVLNLVCLRSVYDAAESGEIQTV